MAKNFRYSGKRITIAGITTDVAAGVLTRQKGFLGIPMNNALSGASVAFALEGVWGLTWDYYAASQPSMGSILYWDTSAGALSIGGGNDDYPVLKVAKAVSSTDGSFDGLLLPQGKPKGQDQS